MTLRNYKDNKLVQNFWNSFTRTTKILLSRTNCTQTLHWEAAPLSLQSELNKRSGLFTLVHLSYIREIKELLCSPHKRITLFQIHFIGTFHTLFWGGHRESLQKLRMQWVAITWLYWWPTVKWHSSSVLLKLN